MELELKKYEISVYEKGNTTPVYIDINTGMDEQEAIRKVMADFNGKVINGRVDRYTYPLTFDAQEFNYD